MFFNVFRMRRSSFIFSQYPSPVYYDFAVTLIVIYILYLSIYNLHKVRLGERENKIFVIKMLHLYVINVILAKR